MTLREEKADHYRFAIEGSPWSVFASHSADSGWTIYIQRRGVPGLGFPLCAKVGDRDFSRTIAKLVARTIEYVGGNKSRMARATSTSRRPM